MSVGPQSSDPTALFSGPELCVSVLQTEEELCGSLK